MNTIGSDLPAALTAPASAESGEAELGQQDFLKLMVTQLKNQDPSKPMESGDFLGQIAQFGTVSGISDLRSSFESVSSALVQEQSLRAASLLDRDVLVNTDRAPLSESGSLTGAVDVPGSVTSVSVEIAGPGGERVDTFELDTAGAGLTDFTWGGTDSNGEPVPSGDYSVQATATIDGQTERVPVLLNARAEGIELDTANGQVQVDIGTAGLVRLEDIRRIN